VLGDAVWDIEHDKDSDSDNEGDSDSDNHNEGDNDNDNGIDNDSDMDMDMDSAMSPAYSVRGSTNHGLSKVQRWCVTLGPGDSWTCFDAGLHRPGQTVAGVCSAHTRSSPAGFCGCAVHVGEGPLTLAHHRGRTQGLRLW
jgi:hypothetical protein